MRKDVNIIKKMESTTDAIAELAFLETVCVVNGIKGSGIIVDERCPEDICTAIEEYGVMLSDGGIHIIFHVEDTEKFSKALAEAANINKEDVERFKKELEGKNELPKQNGNIISKDQEIL